MVNQFVFNRGQFTQMPLPTLPVIGPLDPVQDRGAQLRPRLSPAPVEDVLLQHGEERFHRRIIPGRPDPTHRPDQPETLQSMLELPRPKLRTPIAINHAPGHGLWPATTGHGVLDRRHRQTRLHPRSDGVADDLVAEHFLDRAHVELALTGVMLRGGTSRLRGNIG